MAAAAGGVDRIRSAARNLEAQSRSMIEDYDANILMAKMVAEDLERGNNTASVKEMEEVTLEIIKFSDKLRHHSLALQELSNEYLPKAESTDFQKLLKDRMQQLETASSSSDAQNHQFFKQFKEAVWNVHHAGEPMPGQEQDELVMLASQWGIRNHVCPLSGKPVIDLTDAVRSKDCQHIYSHEAVIEHMRRHNAAARRRRQVLPCPCPCSGCPKTIVESNLLCDQTLNMDIQELRRRGETNQEDIVVDYTNLDED
ncbi:unnamed protein product [Sphagnum troendelagicum]|uniref:SP-RING-type domain-containing protein n=1 Tax=Sphagnum troendelagicum TaxID=128251 RepID=A0ABP0TSE3_9BRYO